MPRDPFFRHYYRYKLNRFLKDRAKKFIFIIGSLLFSFRRRDQGYRDARKILFISLYFIGDLLFHTPVIRIIRRIYPDAQIDVWVKSRTKDILKGNDDIDNVLIFDDIKTAEYGENPKLNLNGKTKFIKKLRGRHYDLIIDFTGLFSTAICTFLANPKFSIGRNVQGFGFLYNKHIDYDTFHVHGNLMIKYMDIIKAGLSIDDNDWQKIKEEIPPKPIICLTKDIQDKVEKELRLRKVDQSKPIICMHLGSGWEAKRWSILRFSELIKKLLEDNDFEIVIVGGSNDNGIFDELAAGLRDFIPTNKLERMFIQMNILETAELIRRSAVFIGSDSGPLHLAGAVNVPTVGLFGPTNPDFSNPIGERHNVIYRKLNCSASYHNQYCNRNAGKNCTTLECMKDISADEVFDSVAMLLRKYHHIDAISGSF